MSVYEELAETWRLMELMLKHHNIHVTGLGCCCLTKDVHCPKCPTHVLVPPSSTTPTPPEPGDAAPPPDQAQA